MARRRARTAAGPTGAVALRATATGTVQGVGFRAAAVARARALGVRGWVRHGGPGELRVHAEGAAPAVDAFVAFLREGPPPAAVADLALERAGVEGHEQFAIRGVAAGRFVVRADAVDAGPFELRLEVDGAVRAWVLPRAPSMDPAVRRLAVEAADAARDRRSEAGGPGGVWDHGTYEQGGRVPWPDALARGHAVFVLHGTRLRGGFALQRTRVGRDGRAQWLLVKRRDEHARSGAR